MDDDSLHADTYGLLCPSGLLATRITSECYISENLHVDPGWSLKGDGFDEFPEFERFIWEGSGPLVVDAEGTEFRTAHCRNVKVAYHWDRWNDAPFEPWDPEIVAACARVCFVGAVLSATDKLRRWAPPGWVDTTVDVALRHLIEDRARGEIAELEAKIAEYRKGRVEPERVFDPEMEEADEDIQD